MTRRTQWIASEDSIANTKRQEEERIHKTRYVNVAKANLRAAPSTSSLVVGQCGFGEDVLCADSIVGEWQAVTSGSDTVRWIHKDLLSGSIADAVTKRATTSAAQESQSKSADDLWRNNGQNHRFLDNPDHYFRLGLLHEGTSKSDARRVAGPPNEIKKMGFGSLGNVEDWFYQQGDYSYILLRFVDGALDSWSY